MVNFSITIYSSGQSKFPGSAHIFINKKKYIFEDFYNPDPSPSIAFHKREVLSGFSWHLCDILFLPILDSLLLYYFLCYYLFLFFLLFCPSLQLFNQGLTYFYRILQRFRPKLLFPLRTFFYFLLLCLGGFEINFYGLILLLCLSNGIGVNFLFGDRFAL